MQKAKTHQKALLFWFRKERNFSCSCHPVKAFCRNCKLSALERRALEKLNNIRFANRKILVFSRKRKHGNDLVMLPFAWDVCKNLRNEVKFSVSLLVPPNLDEDEQNDFSEIFRFWRLAAIWLKHDRTKSYYGHITRWSHQISGAQKKSQKNILWKVFLKPFTCRFS